jgi:BirA family biotin operon repressor/biotin-[acetyl-CoA-carboxylase] ligase
MILNEDEKNLLTYLSEKNVSIAELKTHFGAHILDKIKALQEAHIPILETDSQHFTLPIPYQIPNRLTISDKLALPLSQCFYFDSIDSTQSYLKKLKRPSPALCLAQMQTQGRGRQNKVWYTSFGLNLCYSLQLCLPLPIKKCVGLSLVTGLACIKALEKLVKPSHPIKLKWPNDIWVNQQKLSGILIDIQNIYPDATEIIIGIGMNINSLNTDLKVVDKSVTSLRILYQQIFSLEAILIALSLEIMSYLKRLTKYGFEDFLEEWQRKDALYHQPIKIMQQQQEHLGIAMGIDKEANLLVKTGNGQILKLNQGETSIL